MWVGTIIRDMGRGGKERTGATLLYGAPMRRCRTSRDDASPDPWPVEDDGWSVGDEATWYPNWAPGPVDVVIDSFPAFSPGAVNVEIVTPEIEETGQIWSAHLTELDPA